MQTSLATSRARSGVRVSAVPIRPSVVAAMHHDLPAHATTCRDGRLLRPIGASKNFRARLSVEALHEKGMPAALSSTAQELRDIIAFQRHPLTHDAIGCYGRAETFWPSGRPSAHERLYRSPVAAPHRCYQITVVWESGQRTFSAPSLATTGACRNPVLLTCGRCISGSGVSPSRPHFSPMSLPRLTGVDPPGRHRRRLPLLCPLLPSPPPPTFRSLPPFPLLPSSMCCGSSAPPPSGAWFRSTDLWVMSPTR